MAEVKKTFESNLSRLEEIVTNLEQNELNLSDALSVFEENQILIKNCESDLKKAEQKVKKLIKSDSEDGDSFQLELI